MTTPAYPHTDTEHDRALICAFLEWADQQGWFLGREVDSTSDPLAPISWFQTASITKTNDPVRHFLDRLTAERRQQPYDHRNGADQ